MNTLAVTKIKIIYFQFLVFMVFRDCIYDEEDWDKEWEEEWEEDWNEYWGDEEYEEEDDD